MRRRSSSKRIPAVLLLSCAALLLAGPAAALDADYWRGGWRTPLGDEPHIYEFVIRGKAVTGVYCANCSDATTIGFIDGTWDEMTGIDFTVTFPNPDGSIKSVDPQHATLAEGQLLVTPAGAGRATVLRLVKDPRGADPGGAPAYHLPPGTPPALPVTRPAATAGGGGGAGGGGVGSSAYWPPAPFKPLRPADLVGTWISTSFGPLGMNKQIFTFLLVGDRLRGVVCGRCDNTYTIGAMENIFIAGNTLYFTIVHQDWGEIAPPFDRNITAQVVQNEMIAAILGTNLTIDAANPPARPAGRGFTLVGPIAPAATKGNSSEGIDVWGPGTGSAIQPPPGRIPIGPARPAR